MPQKKKVKSSSNASSDSAYLLKLILYVIIGSQWLRLTTAGGSQIPIPLGLFIGFTFALHEHFRLDRKIEYAVLLVAMLVGYYANVGIFVNL